MSRKTPDVMITGGGPVGLYLAGRLIQNGHTCKVLEKRDKPDLHSKSLGIHPVSMELFEKAGIAEQFLKKGLKINRGIAFWNREKIGMLHFDSCPEPFNFILAIPQWQTEKILETWLLSLDKHALIRGAEVSGLSYTQDSVTVTYRKKGKKHSLTSALLAGCDGKDSFVREQLQIPFKGSPYPDCYIMGDFTDNTRFGTDAAVFLHRDGLIESFPLPDGQRRWVLKTEAFIEPPEPNVLTDLVHQRIGHTLDDAENSMMSTFGVQHYLSETLHKKNILLAGDAAHVVSPIGGQGMNLGWLDAEACMETLKEAIQAPENQTELFRKYSNERKKIARQVARRAEINMWLGRKQTSGLLTKTAVTLMTKKPFSNLFARLFTMRGLGRWWV
jgi:2-polyprenyl-6-methoxyphenol hydroxylase-like FAD-dependent oxidoreductase